MSQKYTIFILFLYLTLYNLPVFAAQHALVVGIDEYQNEEKLEGAVNDATLLRDTLRGIRVQLPDERVLLDSQATRDKVIRAWREMVTQARPRDTLIFTYSGHGGQETDAHPFDEEDGKDETLILYQGRITDDELTGLFAEASEYKILFVADSCHSGGITRSACRNSRWARYSSYRSRSRSAFPTLFKQSDRDMNKLSHVTYITAANQDSISICEYELGGKLHGALSWFFAKALKGEANDGTNNWQLTRGELDDYLPEKVRDATNNKQTPKLLPRGDSQSVISLGSESAYHDNTPPLRPDNSAIAIKVENGSAPPGLKRIRQVGGGFDLRFVVKYPYTEVFNHTNDKIATVSSHKTDQWQRVIDKKQLLKTLADQFDMRLRPIRIELREGPDLHRYGERLHFSIAPAAGSKRSCDKGLGWCDSTASSFNAMTLFNLAGNGDLQFLYPLKDRKHSPIIKRFPYHLPPLTVVPPFGGDNLVAVLCTRPPTRLQRLLQESAPHLPSPAQVIETLHDQRCQVGQYAFFSGE
ncbi:MAG TPA: caspase family protein [Thioploca sp.]|nr:MAG: hypothetical protein DRR19_19630 [Gammaproteobacteria bacterium]HDN25577.1 caspase family protein [Thioploca sp.]